MTKAVPIRKLNPGDESGTFILVSISEYKPDTKGYITTWYTPRGLRVMFLKANDFIGIDHFGRVE